ncbi:MAG: hypothetical protein U9P80_05195, partial [Thermodesulfobacteriota bacterium]|nr:hypothetical protein [Thermodesulfobacteriota bacterium]
RFSGSPVSGFRFSRVFGYLCDIMILTLRSLRLCGEAFSGFPVSGSPASRLPPLPVIHPLHRTIT